MNRILTLALVLAMGATSAYGAQCKDPKTHKFIKCPAAVSAASVATAASTPKTLHCSKGKACGNACIAVTKVCHKP